GDVDIAMMHCVDASTRPPPTRHSQRLAAGLLRRKAGPYGLSVPTRAQVSGSAGAPVDPPHRLTVAAHLAERCPGSGLACTGALAIDGPFCGLGLVLRREVGRRHRI